MGGAEPLVCLDMHSRRINESDNLDCVERAAMKRKAMTMSMDSLTEDLFSLDEPWRGRFLNLVASRATMKTGERRQPTPEEVAAWFEANPFLRRSISLLLYTWQGARRRSIQLERTFSGKHRRNGS